MVERQSQRLVDQGLACFVAANPLGPKSSKGGRMWRGHPSLVYVRPTDRSVFGQSLVLVPLAPLVVAAMLFRLLRNRAQCGLRRAVRLPSAPGRASYAGAPEGLRLSFQRANEQRWSSHASNSVAFSRSEFLAAFRRARGIGCACSGSPLQNAEIANTLFTELESS